MSEAVVFGGTAEVLDVDESLKRVEHTARGQLVQLFDARCVAGEEHLLTALHKAKRAFERGENISQRLELEVMLYAAGTRQLKKAFEMGIKEGMC
ncbi:MAG: KEOPS complex subunit Cgi121, partial [Methermicoccaceae archaeon]